MDKWMKKNFKGARVLKALLASYIITGILLLVLAMVMYKLDLAEGKVTIGIIAIYILSCFIGGLIIGKGAPSRRFIWGLGIGIAYFAILTIISFAVNRELQGSIVNMVTTFIMCGAGGMLGGMIS